SSRASSSASSAFGGSEGPSVIYVVGSGPAGVACALALIRRGLAVTMLDAGEHPEPHLQAAVARLGARPPAEWDPADVAQVRRPTEARGRTIPLKAAFGSVFPYREVARRLTIERRGVDASPSFARGGLSNVWGATVLPYHE